MRYLLLAAMAISSMSVKAQEPAPPKRESKDGDVVVTGKRTNQGEQVSDFVRALSNVTGPDPIARFDRTDICPVAIGLGSHDTAITARMRKIAAAAKLPVAAVDCKPNNLVIFAANKEEMIAALSKAHPAYFRDGLNRVITVPRVDGPATAWHLSARLDPNNVLIPDGTDGPTNVTDPNGGSRIRASIRPIFVASVVVIEWKAVDGLTTTQIADYAAMRSFAEIDPARLHSSSAPTILNVLEAPMGTSIPLSLTQWDLSYLKSLYATPDRHSSYSQRADMSRKINADLNGRSATVKNEEEKH